VEFSLFYFEFFRTQMSRYANATVLNKRTSRNHPNVSPVLLARNCVAIMKDMRVLCVLSAQRCKFKKNAGRQNSKKKKNFIRSEPGFPVFREAVSAINRPALSWLEGDFALFSAV